MPTTQGVVCLFVLLLLPFSSALRERKRLCSGKCVYDPFVIFGYCNGVDLQIEPTISARNVFSGCAICDRIDPQDVHNNKGPKPGFSFSFPSCLPSSIDIFRLQDLQVSRLTGALFATLPYLQYLYVVNGTVDSIEPGTFNNIPRLNTLVIDGNKLQRLACGWFNDLPSLQTLRLHDNRISLIEAGTFQNLTVLSFLGLSQNYLTHLKREYFEGLSALEFIDLNHNKIEAIEPGTFKPLTYLMVLDLSGNRLTVLAEGWSVGLENFLMTLSMADNTFRCSCTSAWMPEYLSVQSATQGVDSGAVCQVPPELKGEEITEPLMQRLQPCLPPRVTVSAQNDGQTFTCEVYWEEEPYISWHLPGSLVLTVPGRYEGTTSQARLENITTRVEHNVSLEGWTFPCAVPKRNVSNNNTTCGNFAGKTASLLVIGQSQAARWNNQAVRCVASYRRGSSMSNATASAVISVEEPLVEMSATEVVQVQTNTYTTEVTTSTTTVVLQVLLGGSAPDNKNNLYIWISVPCAVALAVLWGCFLIGRFCCGQTEDFICAKQGPADDKEETTGMSDHEYATIKDEDCESPYSDVLRDNEYEEIRDDVTSSAYLQHGQSNNKETRKRNPFYTSNICENRPHGLYTISENDGAEDAGMSGSAGNDGAGDTGSAEVPSGNGNAEDSGMSGNAEVPSGNGDAEDTGISGSAEGPSGNGDAEDSDVSGSAKGPSGNGNVEDSGMSGNAEVPSGNGDSEDAGMSGSAEVTSGNGNAKDSAMSGSAEVPSGNSDAEDCSISGSAEELSGNDEAEHSGMSGSAEGPSRNGDAEDAGVSGSAEGPSGNDSSVDCGVSDGTEGSYKYGKVVVCREKDGTDQPNKDVPLH
ncbi:RTN4R [Branchiostoma lanceolatum]|uniref:RTN4R protein n=1 Tax=Branchiostoma lanceolatum TaxID=7740 RepID=A0A8K0A1A4_BRALA|nr:RTN4R [Branchiostoma lanceolatum]